MDGCVAQDFLGEISFVSYFHVKIFVYIKFCTFKRQAGLDCGKENLGKVITVDASKVSKYQN